MVKSPRRVRARNPFLYPLIIVVALAVIAGGGFFWYRQQQDIAQASVAATSAAVQATSQGQTAVAQAAQSAVTATAAAALAEIERQYQAALAFQTAGDYEQARAGFQAVITLNPGYKDSAARLKQAGDALADGYYQQAVAAADQKLWPDAVANFDKVLAIVPNYKDTAARRAVAAKALNATSTPKPATPTPTAQPTAEPGATIPIISTAVGDTNAPTATPAATNPITATSVAPSANVPSFAGDPGKHAQAIAAVESEHPYKNNEDKSWTIPNDSGKSAARIHFSRIELENNVDMIELRDAEDRLIQAITTSAPEGLWSDLVPGAVIKVVLKSESSGNFWGFAIDKIEPIELTTLAYSPHPYPNNSAENKVLINDTPNPAGTRVHFDFIDMEDGVDYLVIMDVNDNPYQWITGSHPDGFTSKAVSGSSIKVQLVSDGSGRTWGYNIDKLETAPEEKADLPPDHPKALAESDHPYANNFSKVWTITNPDVSAISSKIHFSRIGLEYGDVLQVLDANDTVIQIFARKDRLTDVWSDYVPGRVVKIKLTTTQGYEEWGMRVDVIVSSVRNPGIVQSHHPYANDTSNVWTITNPDVSAVSSKIHFAQIALEYGDILQILDADDTVIQTFAQKEHISDLWSDYVPGRVVKVKLATAQGYEDWGFRVDAIVNSVSNPGLAQSSHPYANNFTKSWSITNPDANATASRIHFSRIALEYGDTLQILDANDTVIQTFARKEQLSDLWSDLVRGRVVKIKLTTTQGYEHWGFRADDIQTVK